VFEITGVFIRNSHSADCNSVLLTDTGQLISRGDFNLTGNCFGNQVRRHQNRTKLRNVSGC
jgi:hypothetical protein